MIVLYKILQIQEYLIYVIDEVRIQYTNIIFHCHINSLLHEIVNRIKYLIDHTINVALIQTY